MRTPELIDHDAWCDTCFATHQPCPGRTVHCMAGEHCVTQYDLCTTRRDSHGDRCCHCKAALT